MNTCRNAEMNTNPFADLFGSFEVTELVEGQLDDASSIQAAIAEKQLRNTHWRLSFSRVQYGILHGEPVCLIAVEGRFHAEESKRHRFTWVRISAEFQGQQSLVEMLSLAPERAYGMHSPEERMSHWTLSSSISIAIPGIPITVDLFNAELGRSKRYSIDNIASMQGSKRGFPKAKEAVWTLEEARQEGIPWKIPTMIVILKCLPGATFIAKFNVQAKINASLDPRSWPLLKASATPVPFDGKAELIPPNEKLDGDFTALDITKLTKLDFAEDR